MVVAVAGRLGGVRLRFRFRVIQIVELVGIARHGRAVVEVSFSARRWCDSRVRHGTGSTNTRQYTPWCCNILIIIPAACSSNYDTEKKMAV